MLVAVLSSRVLLPFGVGGHISFGDDVMKVSHEDVLMVLK